jgi:hypothetical protein
MGHFDSPITKNNLIHPPLPSTPPPPHKKKKWHGFTLFSTYRWSHISVIVLHTSWSLSPKPYTCTILLNCWSNKFYYASSQNNLVHGLISKVDSRIPIHKNTHNCLGDCNTKFVVVNVKGWVSCQLASIHLHPISTNFAVFYDKQLWNYWKDYQWSWEPCYDSCKEPKFWKPLVVDAIPIWSPFKIT